LKKPDSESILTCDIGEASVSSLSVLDDHFPHTAQIKMGGKNPHTAAGDGIRVSPK